MRASVSVDDFLKHIYLLGRDERLKVTGSLLAKTLAVSNAAVTDMARKLSRKGLVKYEKYQALTLTPQGLAHAMQLVRRHRLWETFLHHVLKLDLQSIHTEAERLEHQSSDELIAKIADFLGHPTVDPHGDPIPMANGLLQEQDNIVRLSDLKVDESGTVVRLGYKTKENTMFYDKHGIELGSIITVITVLTAEKSVEAITGEHRFYAGQRQADQIYLQKTIKNN
jgi:DtxR family transcriptional regulator, Mn-dependent transcriptional regulator